MNNKPISTNSSNAEPSLKAALLKSGILLSGLMLIGWLSGQLWYYLGDQNNFINSYFEVHHSRFAGSASKESQIYYVFYKDYDRLFAYSQDNAAISQVEPSSLKQLAAVTIARDSLPKSLDDLRATEFVSFVLPGTFPFICH